MEIIVWEIHGSLKKILVEKRETGNGKQEAGVRAKHLIGLLCNLQDFGKLNASPLLTVNQHLYLTTDN